MHTYIAGEDLKSGQMLAIDPDTGKAVRAEADKARDALFVASRDYAKDEVIRLDVSHGDIRELPPA